MPHPQTRRDILLAIGSGLMTLALGACGGTTSAAVTATGTSVSTSARASSTVASRLTASSATTTVAPGTSTAASRTTASAPQITAAAASTGAAVAAPVTLTIMSESDFNDNWSPAFWQSYSKANPNVNVDPEPQTCGNCDTKFTSLFAANTPPDVIITGGNGMIDWGIAGAVTGLNDRIAQSKIIRTANFIPRALDEGSWQGKIYGLYWSGDARMLYWNKDLFRAAGLDPEKPPQTWDDFTTAMQKLTKAGADGSIQQLGYDPTYNSVGGHWWETWFWELGGSYLSADGTTVTIADDKGAEALEFMVKQAQVQGGWTKVSDYYAAVRKDAGKATSTVGFGFGLQKVAMMTEVSNVVANVKKFWPTINYGIAGIPAAATGKRASVRGGYSWVLPANTPRAEAGWGFLEWIFAPAQELAYNNRFGRVPATLDAQNSGAWLPDEPQVRQVSAEVMGYGQRIPCIAPGYTQILPINGGIPTPVLEGKLTAQVELQTAQTQIQAILTQALQAAKK